MEPASYQLSRREAKALEIIKTEKQQWETATCFISERVAFQMRNLIRLLRKNYYGVFETPVDETTGRKKIWIPLTESLVEGVVKNIDMDTKDINFRAKKPEAVPLSTVIRAAVRCYLDEMYFGEKLDQLERDIAIDGTGIWKTFEQYDEQKKKKVMKVNRVDPLNFYIDPTAPDIQDPTVAVIERSLLTVDEFKQMDWPMNKDVINPSRNLNRYDGDFGGYSGQAWTQGEIELVEVYERWGKVPKWVITGDEENDKDWIDARIVATGGTNNWAIHLIEENKTGMKPYEECWYTRVPNRWYGKGVAEKVMWLQLWLNTIVNTRITRSYMSQLGIFKIKKGAGITSQMLSRLPANGAVVVNSMDDIQQMAVQEASQASYADEQNIQGWAERVTSAFEAATGESLPASTSATGAAIQARSAQSQFTLVKEGVGMFLQRWLKRHAIPIIMKNLKAGDIIQLTGDIKEIRALDERVVNQMIYEEINKMTAQGYLVDPMQIEMERQRAMEELQTMGEQRFIALKDKIDYTEYDVQVYITNEEIDKGVLSQNLLSALQAAPEYREQIIQQLFDVMGVGPLKTPEQPPMMAQQQAEQPGMPNLAMMGANPQQAVTQANAM